MLLGHGKTFFEAKGEEALSPILRNIMTKETSFGGQDFLLAALII